MIAITDDAGAFELDYLGHVGSGLPSIGVAVVTSVAAVGAWGYWSACCREGDRDAVRALVAKHWPSNE